MINMINTISMKNMIKKIQNSIQNKIDNIILINKNTKIKKNNMIKISTINIKIKENHIRIKNNILKKSHLGKIKNIKNKKDKNNLKEIDQEINKNITNKNILIKMKNNLKFTHFIHIIFNFFIL